MAQKGQGDRRRHAWPVDAEVAGLPLAKKARVTQHAQVLRDGQPADIGELGGDVACGELAIPIPTSSSGYCLTSNRVVAAASHGGARGTPIMPRCSRKHDSPDRQQFGSWSTTEIGRLTLCVMVPLVP
jgi:hypothetical protein